MKKLIWSALSSDAFWSVNKKLAKHIGIEEAVFLSDLISKERYFSERGQLDDQDGFFNTTKNLTDDLGISERAKKRIQSRLIELNIVSIKKRGVPAKNYWYLNHELILKIMSSQAETVPTGQDETDPSCECETAPAINKNKEIKINNNNIQASPDSVIFDNHIEQSNIVDNHKPDKTINKTEPDNLTKQVTELFDKANINLTGKKLSWVGKGEQYGKNIKLIIQAAENDFEEIRKRAAKLFELVKTDDWHKKQGFTPSSLLSNWNKLADINRNAKSFDAKEKIFPDWQNMTEQEIETVFNDKKFPFQTGEILEHIPAEAGRYWKDKFGHYRYSLAEVLIKYKRGELNV